MYNAIIRISMKKIFFTTLMYVGACCSMTASSAAFPSVRPLPAGTIVSALSDNGLWGISQSGGETESGELYNNGGSVWDIQTLTSTDVLLPKSGIASINDITDDGKLVVGSCDGLPATYDMVSQKWTTLPLPSGATGGNLLAVTPDGKRAVGVALIGDEWHAMPAAYDLSTGGLLNLKNIPTVDMNHDVAEINRFCGISADGRYILGRISEQILMPVSMCAYIYDTMTDKVSYIGFKPESSRPWIPVVPDTYFIDHVQMSPKGDYVTGMAYMVHEIDGSDYPDEYYTAFKYEIASDKLEIYDGPYDSDAAGFAITDNGTVFAAMPAVNPYSSMAVRKGNYYYRLDEIYPDFYSRTGLTVTGKAIATDSEGKVLSMLTSTSDSYILNVNDDWNALCDGVNLLASYSVSPRSGATMSALNEMSLTFSRAIDLAGAARRIVLTDSKGETVANAVSATVSDRTLNITFREQVLTPGEKYTVTIRPGFVTMTGDALMGSDEINITYIGRSDSPVKPASISPANGSSFARLDPTSSFVALNFDVDVKLNTDIFGELWRKGETEPFTQLILSQLNSNTVAVYPSSRQYLYDGTDYQVVIPAGAITDLSGNGPNQEIVLEYSGNYVREVAADDRVLFSDDFKDYANFMFFDGDRLAPGEIPAGWGFTAQNPWVLVRESVESSNMALAAHSMFATPGKSDDWAVTPQLFIPDSRCYLQFEAQSYLKNKTDILKVYAYESNNGYSTLTESIVNDIMANGQLVFNEQLSPGQSEEGLEGDWQTYTVDLKDFAGKNIYLAFVNQNENQSAIMLNQVEVIHDLQYLLSITTPSSVVQANDVAIAGSLILSSDVYSIKNLVMTLRNGSTELAKVASPDLNMKKGDKFDFEFPNNLPLNPGVVNRYSIDLLVNGTDAASYNFSIKNLEFSPERKVLIEEYSGRDCANCPLGFLALDNLDRSFPGAIIPVIIRTYESDPLGQGLEDYTSFLGLQNMGAPSAVINRTISCYPMDERDQDFSFSGAGLATAGGEDPVLWFDAVSTIMETAPDAEIDFIATLDNETGKLAINGNTRFALNGSQNVALFGILLENNRSTRQKNNLYAMTDPDLGQWGAGGIYGKSRVDLAINHVARQTYGTTFNGTPDLVPANQTAGTLYPFSMTLDTPDNIDDINNLDFVITMINTDNERAINSQKVKVKVENASISEIVNSKDNQTTYFDLQGRKVASPQRGQLLIKRIGNKASKIIF